MEFRDRSTSRPFREQLITILPKLAGRPDYLRMTGHLLFGTRRDSETKLLMIPAEMLAAMEDRAAGANYSGIKFLDAYRADVLKFELEEYVFHPNPDLCRCRAIKSIVLPAAVETLVKEERRRQKDGVNTDVRVWLSTGNQYLPRHATARRRELQAECKCLAEETNVNSTTYCLLNYLNNLPQTRFTSALKHIPEALAAAENLTDRDNQINLLLGIRDNVQPFYQPASKTTRVYTSNESILRLHRDLRKIMTQDWITADLRSAQLAIVAKQWRIDYLTDYLADGRSVWPDLCEHMEMEFTGDNKAVMKRLIYAITFGAEERKQKAILREHQPLMDIFKNGTRAHKHLLEFDLIPSILRARERQFDYIDREKGAEDAFGHVVPLVTENGYGNHRSVLASVAQSWELKLLMPVIGLAIQQQYESHGFTMTTFLHDGFTFETHHNRDVDYWKDKLFTLVVEQAKQFGIITSLEFE